MNFDLDSYRESAERFEERIGREYYLHLAGHKPGLEIDAIYAEHAELFKRGALGALRELAATASGEERRRLRALSQFALDGLLGQATKAESVAIAELESSLEVDLGSEAVPYRQVPVEQANEPDPARRELLAEARDALLVEHLNPHYRAALEGSHAICAEQGWASYSAAYADLRGIDLAALASELGSLLEATEDVYAQAVDPELERAGLPPLGELRRADVPRFFRAPELDEPFPEERLIGSLSGTLSGLGIALDAQPNVTLDVEPRPTKSPRAFCSPLRVPDEVVLVIAPVGGRDDYAALFHEAGHTEHYASVDPALPFEFRNLGDNSVTESFAFLIEHLTEDGAWLGEILGVADPQAILDHARAGGLIMIRRYAAKIAYELELHGAGADLEAMPERYSALLGDATRVATPQASWLTDVDPGFYVACYLRAWALEAAWRRSLRQRFGERWFAEPEAGAWLRSLWGEGQRLDATELAERELGSPLDFGPLVSELRGEPA